MAHQTSNIPWNALASNLRWSVAEHPGQGERHDLVLRLEPNQGRDFNYFVETFERTLLGHSAASRKKYPERYDLPDPEDIILDDAAVERITPTVRRFLADDKPRWMRVFGIRQGPCQIPHEERKASSFWRKYEDNGCYEFDEVNGKAFFNLELVKALLIHGEMDIVLRACAHPDMDVENWWSATECGCGAYIGLNVIYCFPETWDPAAQRTDGKDYRRTRIYQYTLVYCTESGRNSDVAAYPHQDFFGIEDRQFLAHPDLRHPRLREAKDRDPYGLMPIEELLNCQFPRQRKPSPSEVPEVRHILQHLGLPMELVLVIMDMAEYAPRGNLEVPDDPLHPENRRELADYLELCWQLLVRCEMMANAVGMDMEWGDKIFSTLLAFFRSEDGKKPTRDQNIRLAFK